MVSIYKQIHLRWIYVTIFYMKENKEEIKFQLKREVGRLNYWNWCIQIYVVQCKQIVWEHHDILGHL